MKVGSGHADRNTAQNWLVDEMPTCCVGAERCGAANPGIHMPLSTMILPPTTASLEDSAQGHHGFSLAKGFWRTLPRLCGPGRRRQ